MLKLLKRLSVFVFFVVSSITISHDGENTIVVDALTLATKINYPTTTPTSNESNNNFVLRRRDILKIPAAAAAAIGSAFVLAPATILATASTSTVTTTTAIIIEEDNAKLPFPGNQKNIGVLWRTIRGQAAPATPSTLNKLVHSELFGGGSDKVTSSSRKTTGLVCVSERHDDFEHHLVQLHVIQSIRKALDQRHPVVVAKSNTSTRSGFFSAPGAGSKTTTTANKYSSKTFAIGMECFQRKDQPFLDKFVHFGSNPLSIVDTTYTINDLKRDVNWDTNWGYDILHYAPILNQAQKYKLRILGLHPSQDLVDMVSDFGLAELPKKVIAGGVNTKSKDHWERFKQTTQETMEIKSHKFNANGGVGSICDGGIDAYIERLYEVQCFREEYMAETVALHMAKQDEQHKNPGWVVILAGERHILGRDGIPNRALRRMAAYAARAKRNVANTKCTNKYDSASHRGVFTFVPKSVSSPARIDINEAPDHKSADYVWFTQRDPNATFDASVVNAAPTRTEHPLPSPHHHHHHNIVPNS